MQPRTLRCQVAQSSARSRVPAVLRSAMRDGGRPHVAARGTVCIMQGRSEFIEKYFEVVTDLRRRGFAVLAFDWRGQGGSDRTAAEPTQGPCRRFQSTTRTISTRSSTMFCCRTAPSRISRWPTRWEEPSFCRPCRREPDLFARAVAFRADARACRASGAHRAARALAVGLDMVGFGGHFVPGGGETAVTTKPFAGNPVTSRLPCVTRARQHQVAAAPHLGLGDPTIGWVHAALRAMDPFRDPNYPLGVETPILIVAGSADTVTLDACSGGFAARLKAGAVIVVPGAKHETHDGTRRVPGAVLGRFRRVHSGIGVSRDGADA